jgi:alpha-methylacyl-CoA racemase
MCLHRGKRSVAVDVKNPLGVEAVAKLASAADILIEPYRPGVHCLFIACMFACLHGLICVPGVMEKLGLGPEVLCKRNPRLIYARLTGFASALRALNLHCRDASSL